MSSFRIAYHLLKNNLQIYGFYLFVLIVTVATYYNFITIQYNDKFVELTERLQSAVIASMTSGFVLLCTVVFFMWHANGFFFKRRQKETGLYMLMGISTSKIGRVFAIENMLLGGLAMLLGLAVGILFSKLFFMFLGKAMSLGEELPFMIAPEAILQIILVFGLIFVLLGIKNFREVKKSQLINMLNAEKEKPAAPAMNVKKGIFGVLLIVVGDFIALHFRTWDMDLMIASMTTLVLVSMGTYLFFGSFLTVVFRKLIQDKTFIYKNVRLVSFSNVFFRLKENYRSLAMTAILAAATVTALSVSLSFKKYADDHVVIEAPYSISFASPDKVTQDRMMTRIEQSSHKVVGVNEVYFFLGTIDYLNATKKVDPNHEAVVTSYSQVKKTLEFINYEDREEALEKIEPKDSEVTFLLNANTMASPINVKGEEIRIQDQTLRITESAQVPFLGNVEKYGKRNIYVVNDQMYEKLKEGRSEVKWVGLKITDQENSEQLVKNVASLVPGGSTKVNGYLQQYIWEYYALGTFFFLGLIMSMVFVLATFSTIYFKMLSDAFMDKEQYTILKKVGMSREEVQKSVHLQVGIAFLLPVLLGVVHSIVAMNMLEEIMNVNFLFQMIVGIGLFVLVMMAFYVGISSSYTKMVYNESN
ncbi:MAG TPA: FtsX-like permease family protein [Candidatus Bathyarchaeia archaeon]|nr:FtsX-like permease family protein [Candidatus Bathyarchaeia archaeon]